MNRGSLSKQNQPSEEHVASMRPRFMNRGSGGKEPPLKAAYMASMRPRFMNRGSFHAVHAPATRSLRFNEAPIHESGKCDRGLTAESQGRRLQ